MAEQVGAISLGVGVAFRSWHVAEGTVLDGPRWPVTRSRCSIYSARQEFGRIKRLYHMALLLLSQSRQGSTERQDRRPHL